MTPERDRWRQLTAQLDALDEHATRRAAVASQRRGWALLIAEFAATLGILWVVAAR